MPVAVDLGAREEDRLGPRLLLEPHEVLVPDGVAAPERLVEVLAVPPAELGGQVVNVLGLTDLECPLELAKVSDIGTDVLRVGGVVAIEYPDLMSPVPQFAHE